MARFRSLHIVLRFVALGCSPCIVREIKTAGGAEDVDSAHVGQTLSLGSCFVLMIQCSTVMGFQMIYFLETSDMDWI